MLQQRAAAALEARRTKQTTAKTTDDDNNNNDARNVEAKCKADKMEMLQQRANAAMEARKKKWKNKNERSIRQLVSLKSIHRSFYRVQKHTKILIIF